MSSSNAYLYPWPPKVQDEAHRAFTDVMESFNTVTPHVNDLVRAVTEAQGALKYYGTEDLFERLAPVVDFLWFVQNRVTDQGIRLAQDAQTAVYRRWEDEEDRHRVI